MGGILFRERYRHEVLWAKKPKEDEPDQIVRLHIHLKATAEVAKELYETWMPLFFYVFLPAAPG
ncbi:MAG: hypothetical protein FWE11_00405 [Defluviitaleaceae bacterium]|nr:hypothetical protein [Defluviitaleaceae bacterium]